VIVSPFNTHLDALQVLINRLESLSRGMTDGGSATATHKHPCGAVSETAGFSQSETSLLYLASSLTYFERERLQNGPE
jgi:hypothetical protein